MVPLPGRMALSKVRVRSALSSTPVALSAGLLVVSCGGVVLTMVIDRVAWVPPTAASMV